MTFQKHLSPGYWLKVAGLWLCIMISRQGFATGSDHIGKGISVSDTDSAHLVSLLDSLARHEQNDLLRTHFLSVLTIIQDTTHGYEKFSSANEYYYESLHFFRNEGARFETYVNGPRPLMMAFQSPTDHKNSFYWLFLPRKFQRDKKDYSFYMELHGSGGGMNDNPRNMLLEPLGSHPGGVTVQGYRKEGLYIYPWGRGDKFYRGISEKDIFECLHHFDSLFTTAPQRQFLFGFSMGGGGTFHIAGLSPKRWTAIGTISAAFNEVNADDVQKIKHLPVWMIWGEKEYWAINCRKMKDLLVRAGVKLVWREVAGGAHDYDGKYQVELMDWLVKQAMN